MSVADDLAQRLEAAREKFHAVRDFVGPGDSRFKPEVIRMYEAAVEVLEEAHELALSSTPPPAPEPRAPKEAPCLLYTSPSPRDKRQSRMPSSA